MSIRSTQLLLPLILVACGAYTSHTFYGIEYASSEKVSRQEQLSLDLRPGQALRLSTRFGPIEVETTDRDPRVEATITAFAESTEQAQTLLASLRLSQREAGGKSIVEVIEPKEREDKTGYKIELHAYVLKGTPLDIKASFGNIKIHDYDASIHAHTSSGSVTLSNCKGDDIRAESSFGAISLEKIESKSIRAKTKSGAVRAHGIKAENCSLESSFGAIVITQATGNLEANTRSGSIHVADLDAEYVNVSTAFGTITVQDTKAKLSAKSSSGGIDVRAIEGSADLDSGFGKLHVDGVLSSLTARTKSGSVTVNAREGSRCATAWTVRSGFGAIALNLPADFSCQLHATSGFGKVHLNRSASVEPGMKLDTHELEVKLGNGGHALRVHSASGSVRID